MNRSDVEGAELRRVKGVGQMGLMVPRGKTTNPASYATAGAQTLTAADVLSGIIVADPNGAGRTYTFPTAALLVAAIPGVAIGDVITCLVINGADANEVLTLAAGSGGGWDTNETSSARNIQQNAQKLVAIRFTGVASGSEAYVMYA